MADETWINTGGTTQQPYQGQTPANAQNPEPRQTTYTVPANAQSPFTYSNRTPTTYRNPVSQQEPNIRNVQAPFTYNRQGSQPTTYQHRSPFTYQSSESSQTPFTYNHRSPTTYNHRSPSTYQFRTPSTYQFRSPDVYRTPVNAQEPNIRNRQNAYPYIAAGQEPNIRNEQTPYPYIAAGQAPNIRNRQNAYPYIAAGQEPNIRNAQAPFTYQHRSPTTYSFRSPETYQHQSPFTYNHRTPSTYQYRSPFTYNFRSPSTYQHRSPFTYSFQSPYIASGDGRVPYYYIEEEELIDAARILTTDSTAVFDADSRLWFMIAYSAVKGNGRYDIIVTLHESSTISGVYGYSTTQYKVEGSSGWTNYGGSELAYKIEDVAANSGWTVKHEQTGIGGSAAAYTQNTTDEVFGDADHDYSVGTSATSLTSANGLSLCYRSRCFHIDTAPPHTVTASWTETLTFEHASEADQIFPIGIALFSESLGSGGM